MPELFKRSYLTRSEQAVSFTSANRYPHGTDFVAIDIVEKETGPNKSAPKGTRVKAEGLRNCLTSAERVVPVVGVVPADVHLVAAAAPVHARNMADRAARA